MMIVGLFDIWKQMCAHEAEIVSIQLGPPTETNSLMKVVLFSILHFVFRIMLPGWNELFMLREEHISFVAEEKSSTLFKQCCFLINAVIYFNYSQKLIYSSYVYMGCIHSLATSHPWFAHTHLYKYMIGQNATFVATSHLQPYVPYFALSHANFSSRPS